MKQKLMRTIIINLLMLTAIYIFSCNSVEPPPDGEKPTLTLKLEDASCTEAWVTLETTNLQLPAALILMQDEVTRDTINLTTADTLLYIDSLLPNTTYNFHTVIQSSNHSSNVLRVATLDTTSHNFTFETFTWGDIGSSVLYDVTIIDENNIWAVGEIYVADTSINGYTTYNAVHWDGSEWELKRIPFLFQADSFYNPIYAVFAFNADDIWFGIGNLIHWDGTRYFPIDISSVFQSLVNKIWGSSSENLYVIGNNGNIARYNGQSWQRIESGTQLNINDIWGDYNEKTNEWEILAVASNILQSNEKEVLKINSTNTQIINKEGITGTLSSLWFISNYKNYVAGGGGVYENNGLGDDWNKSKYDFTRNFLFRLRGNELNNIAAAGGYGDVLHFNGISWKSYFDETQLSNGNYYSVAIMDNLFVAVGQDNPQAVITVGKRIN